MTLVGGVTADDLGKLTHDWLLLMLLVILMLILLLILLLLLLSLVVGGPVIVSVSIPAKGCGEVQVTVSTCRIDAIAVVVFVRVIVWNHHRG